MPTVEKTMVLYPKSGWRLKQGMTSEMIPKKGNAIDVDLGAPKNQTTDRLTPVGVKIVRDQAGDADNRVTAAAIRSSVPVSATRTCCAPAAP